MPAFRVPRRSGPHRIAAIALYRALLSQCRRLQFEQAPHEELQHLIRNRFRQVRRDTGPTKLRISFEAGYEAVDLLDAAVAGDGECESRILKLLKDAPLKARQSPSPPPTPSNKSQKADKKVMADAQATDEPKLSLFDRPLPLSQLSGKRHVPVLVSANSIPMLRIKKPIPEHLSGYLAKRLKTRQKRFDRLHRMEAELVLADREDEWDGLVAGLEEKGSEVGIAEAMGGKLEPSWREAIKDEIHTIHHLLNKEKRRNQEMAEKMQAVVDRETALYEKEKTERKAANRRRWEEAQHEVKDEVSF